jgi:hypothetical protein
MPPDVVAKTAKTQFKKGNKPYNWKPVGSERINIEGYVEVKIAEPRKWELKHRVVWKQINGEFPEGAIVKFKDGNRQNCDIDNLLLTNRLSLCKENSFYNYPKELQNLIASQSHGDDGLSEFFLGKAA